MPSLSPSPESLPAAPPAITTSNRAFIAADSIKAEHAAAQASAQDAIAHATRCGQLLIEQKPYVGMSFRAYIERVCDMPYSTAKLYMRAARAKANGLAVPTLRSLYPSGRPQARRAQRLRRPRAPARTPTLAEIRAALTAYAAARGWAAVQADVGRWIEEQAESVTEAAA